jgi:glycine cleavage system H protein
MVVLLTFLTFSFFLIFELIVQQKKAKREKESFLVDPKEQRVYQPISELFQNIKINLPKGLFISRGHVWVKVLPKGEVRLGLDCFCPKLITKIDKIELHNPEDRVNNNGGMCTIYQGEKKLTFYSPLDGIIRDVNTQIFKDPKTICRDPFGEGWIYRVRPSLEMSYLMESETMDKDNLDWEKSEVDRLANFVLSDPSTKMLVEENLKKKKFGLQGLLDNLDSFSWLKFEEQFLK